MDKKYFKTGIDVSSYQGIIDWNAVSIDLHFHITA